MTDQYLTQDQLLLARVESTRGTEEAVTPGLDAIKVVNLRFAAAFETDPGDTEHTSSLDPGEPTVLGGAMTATFGVRIKGSGAGGTPPEWGRLLRGCGLTEVISAAAVADTAQAGAAKAITLHAGASTVDDFYKGMVIELAGGPGAGESNVITAYDGTTKIATVARAWTEQPTLATTFSIPANVLYRPASSDLETLTLWGYQNANQSAVQSRLRKIKGGMATFTLSLGSRQIPVLNFTCRGQLAGKPINVARPTGIVFDAGEAPPFRGAESLIGGTPVKFNTLSLDYGANVAQPDDASQEFGLDTAAITARRVTATLTPYLKRLSTRDFMSLFLDQVENDQVYRWGSTAGNRSSLLLPRTRYTGDEETSIDGFEAESVPFTAQGPDNTFWLCMH